MGCRSHLGGAELDQERDVFFEVLFQGVEVQGLLSPQPSAPDSAPESAFSVGEARLLRSNVVLAVLLEVVGYRN